MDGGVGMATKSILKNINITKRHSAKALLSALENAKANPGQEVTYQRPYKELKKDDIKMLFEEH